MCAGDAPSNIRPKQERKFSRALSQIEMDVRRLDDSEPAVVSQGSEALIRILGIWDRLDASAGYRQGMHEIAAMLWRVRARDALPPAAHRVDLTGVADARLLSAAQLTELLRDDEVEADTFTLLQSLLRRLGSIFTERAGSATLFCAVLQRCDPELAAHLGRQQLHWAPILLCVLQGDELTAVAGIACCICTRCEARVRRS